MAAEQQAPDPPGHASPVPPVGPDAGLGLLTDAGEAAVERDVADSGASASIMAFGDRPDLPVDTGVVEDAELARAIRRSVARAMAEDLGDRGDVTSLATVAPTRRGTAQLVARADGVFCGRAVVGAVFGQVDPRIELAFDVDDGDVVTAGQVLATVDGPLRSVLTGERTALNFACHLSGIATRTRRVVDAVDGTGVVVRDTRKTTPGLRLLEKHAVKAGGGSNHRIGLHDALLVKDNHVAAAGSIQAAASAALDRARGRRVQVEVTTLDELRTVLELGVTDVLLDNFDADELRAAVDVAGGRARLEASGNITIDNVRSYAEAGVDRVAMGSITHSAPWLDLALDVTAVPVDDTDRRSPPRSLSSTEASTTVDDDEVLDVTDVGDALLDEALDRDDDQAVLAGDPARDRD